MGEDLGVMECLLLAKMISFVAFGEFFFSFYGGFCRSRTGGVCGKDWLEWRADHRIIESLRLEKTSRTIKSNR